MREWSRHQRSHLNSVQAPLVKALPPDSTNLTDSRSNRDRFKLHRTSTCSSSSTAYLRRPPQQQHRDGRNPTPTSRSSLSWRGWERGERGEDGRDPIASCILSIEIQQHHPSSCHRDQVLVGEDGRQESVAKLDAHTTWSTGTAQRKQP